MKQTKGLNIFEHLANITINKTPVSTYSDVDLKSFDVYMINQWLSMEPDLIDIINALQRYTINMKSKHVYSLYLAFLPQQKYWFKYIKGKKQGKYHVDLINYMCKYFKVSKKIAVEYLNVYYKDENGINEVKHILRKYGVEKKQITKYTKIKT